MRNKTQTLKNMKHLKKITQKIIDNDNKQTQAEIPPSLKETLQKISEEMDKWKTEFKKLNKMQSMGNFSIKMANNFLPKKCSKNLTDTTYL